MQEERCGLGMNDRGANSLSALHGRLLKQGILLQPRARYALGLCQYFLERFP